MTQDIEFTRQESKDWQGYLNELKVIKETFVWVWQELMCNRGRQLSKYFAIVFVISHIFGIMIPWTVSVIFNGLSEGGETNSTIIQGKVFMIVILCFALLSGWIKRRIREFILGLNMRRLDYVTTDLFFQKSLGMHISENNALNDANLKKGHHRVAVLEDAMLFEGIEAIMNVLIPFLALWVLGFYVNNFVIPALNTLLLIVFIFWGALLNRKLIHEGIPIDREWREMDRYREERWRHIEKVKNNYKEKEELENLMNMFDRIIIKDRNLWVNFIDMSHIRGAVCFLGFFVPIFFYGIGLVKNGNIPIGYLFPVYMWSFQLVDNLWRISELEHTISRNAPTIHAIKQVLTMPDGLPQKTNPYILDSNAPCRLELVNVSHGYKETQGGVNRNDVLIPVLKDVSFSVEPGEKIALIGESGAGKTTIKSLLLRYMDPLSGKILIDGVDLRNIDSGSWLTKVGYVPQQAQILDGTIRYNLEYPQTKYEKHMISETRLKEVVNELQIDFGERLVYGLDTLIGRNGIKISGGQAQRLNIGSEVLHGVRFLIIDEATSSLDAITERLVQEGLEKVIPSDIGVLTITHRLSTVKNYDKFILLSGNGQGSTVIAEAFSFPELAEKSHEFRKMANFQGIEL